MSRDPWKLTTTLREAEKKFVDELEKEIDARMDEAYEGGPFRFPLAKGLNTRTLAEVQRRYDQWLVKQESQRDSDTTDHVLVFMSANRSTSYSGEKD